MQWNLKSIVVASIVLLSASFGFAQQTDFHQKMEISRLEKINGLEVTRSENVGGIQIAQPGASCSVTSDGITLYTQDAVQSANGFSGQNYVGIIWDDAGSGSICEVSMQLTATGAGNLADRDFYIAVFKLDGGTKNIIDYTSPTIAGYSDKVDGVDTWNQTEVTFTFTTPVAYDCTGTDQYGIALMAVANGNPPTGTPTLDNANYPSVGIDIGAAKPTGQIEYARWSGIGIYVQLSDANTFMIKVSTQ